MKKNQCKVCGARITSMLTDTCDRTCARAARSGVTRPQQERFDLRFFGALARRQEKEHVAAEKQRRKNLEDLFYNQPYLIKL